MPSSPGSDPLIGTLLDGRYDITRRIARGGMATVYLATDRRLDREVAVKVMHAHMVDDEQFMARFIREARSAARISDPHVVAVYDQGRQGDVLYLVMEYVPGLTLRDILNQQGPLTPGQALDVLIPVLDALTAAYQAGIVHRDIKPENVLLRDTGRGTGVKVTDFGLARAVADSNRTASSTGTVIGTPSYLSPELITQGVADARSDVYSAGTMLYEMLVGNPPFEGEVPVQVAFRHVNEDVPAPTEADPGLPGSLDGLVLAATARDPDERPTDAAAYAAMVRRVRATLTEEELDRDPEGRPVRGGGRAPGLTRPVDLHGGRAPEPTGGARQFPTVRAQPVVSRTQRLAPGPDFQAPGTRSLPEFSRAQAHEPRRPATFPGASPLGRRRRPRTSTVLATLLILAVVVAAVGWYAVAGPGAYTTMPDVKGTRTQVTGQLSAGGFTPTVQRAYSESVPAGAVIRTEPAGGSRVHKHSDVTVLVSRGTAWTTMPSVVGMNRDRATATLDKLDIRIADGPQQEYSDTVPEGAVIRSSPAPTQRVKRGSTVTVTVSRGAAPVNVPDVGGQTQAQATQALHAAGLRVNVTSRHDDTAPKGKVLSQNPGSGGQAHRGDTVAITVSSGPTLVSVPSVVGRRLDDAKSTLEDAGFKVKVDNVMGGFFGTVRSQNPAGDKQVPKGSTITLTVV